MSDQKPLPGSGPLAGVRVIDLTQAWAGPMCTRTLAFLGAEVIKIESPTRIDVWRGAYRGGNQERFPDFDPGEKPYNRNSLFNTQNHDKLALSLDLKAEGAKEILFDLVRISDVVVANFAPAVLDRLGIGYEVLRKINPRIIVAEMPAFGLGGPMTAHVGMGKTMEAAAGMVSLIGYGDEVPVTTGPAYLDPIGGLHGAAAIVTALYSRSQRNEGAWVDVAQTEAAALWIGEYLLQELYEHTAPEPRGNKVVDAAPHDAYPCEGTDEWVAIAVRTDVEWRNLCEVINRTDLIEDPRFASFAARSENQDELYPIISAWTENKNKHDAAAELQAHGVPAAPVNNGGDVANDPGLHAAHFFTELDHPEAGRHEYPGLGYRLSRTPGSMRQPSPVFGQHNQYVLTEILHLDQERIDELARVGAIASDPHEGHDIN
jgi:crotonobetainyl-CoA:carnitine CoA-transferase CaiB-like acyl-CoA transferase